MHTDDQELLQEILLEHGNHPRNDHVPADAGLVREVSNPQKGDRVRLGLRFLGDGRIAAIGFEASGSTVLKASCSLLTEALLGKTRKEALAFTEKQIAMLQDPSLPVSIENWGETAALGAIRRFPARVQCASMPWRLAKELLRG